MTTYTSGDWSVSDQYTDTVATPKDISVPDLDFANDFALTKDEATEAVYTNITADDVRSHESIRFACSPIANIYQGFSVQSPSSIKNGVQVMAELSSLYKAVNSVSGVENEIPVKGRIVLRIPTHSFVTSDLVADALFRVISSIFSTGAVSEARALDLVKGILKA